MNILFPETLAALWQAWREHPDASIFAGGTDLFVRLRGKSVQPDVLIGLERLSELNFISAEGDKLVVGAAVNVEELRNNQALDSLQVLREALDSFASPPIRHSATIGGNLCTASPAGDCLPALYVLDAIVILASVTGRREMAVADFIIEPGRTALAPGEIVAAVKIPLPPREAITSYSKVGKRKALAIAVTSMASVVIPGPGRQLSRVRLAWGSVGPTVATLPETERLLAGKPLTMELLRQAAAQVAAAVKPIGDVRSSAAYRRQVAGNLLLKALWPYSNEGRDKT